MGRGDPSVIRDFDCIFEHPHDGPCETPWKYVDRMSQRIGKLELALTPFALAAERIPEFCRDNEADSYTPLLTNGAWRSARKALVGE